MGQHLAHQVFLRHGQGLHAGVLQLAHVARGDALALLDDDVATDLDFKGGGVAAQALGHQAELDLVLRQEKVILL